MNPQNQNQSFVPKPPKGTGLSPVAVGIISVVIVIFMVVLLALGISYHQAPKRTVDTDTKPKVQQSDDSAQYFAQVDSQPSGIINDGSTSTDPDSVPSGFTHQNTSHVNASHQADGANAALDAYNQAASSAISAPNINYGSNSDSNGSGNSHSVSNSMRSATPQLNLPSLDGLTKGGNDYASTNMQSEKKAFVSTSGTGKSDYLDSHVQKVVSPYEIQAGTIISAYLLTGINSDLPGQITAKVTQSVYDTVTGNYLLIPQGTTLLGVYDSSVAYGQSRVLIAWNRLIFPNGNSIDLEGQPGVDLVGQAGLHDLVNNHYARIFGSALMFSMFGALGQLSQPQQSNNQTLSASQLIYAAVGQQIAQTSTQLIAKNMNIQPTIQIRQGDLFNVLLTRDMVLDGPYQE